LTCSDVVFGRRAFDAKRDLPTAEAFHRLHRLTGTGLSDLLGPGQAL